MNFRNTPSVHDIKNCYNHGSLWDFFYLSQLCHCYVLNNTQQTHIFYDYHLRETFDGPKRETRPINSTLFVFNNFRLNKNDLYSLIGKANPTADIQFRLTQRKFIYTIQQSVGAYLDLVSDHQGARKIAGEFFQGLIREIFASQYHVSSGTISFDIREADGINEELRRSVQGLQSNKDAMLKLSFDQLVRPLGYINDDNTDLSPPCVVCGVKTTTKDRGNMFYVDKFLYEATHSHRPTFISVVLNDVQRKKTKGVTTGISYTFLGGHNRLYSYIMGNLDGYYFVDPPPLASEGIRKGEANLKTIDVMINDDLPRWLT